MKNETRFPAGWNEERVQRLLQHYESQTEEEAVAEDEAVLEDTTQTVMEIPNALVPSVRALLSQHAERICDQERIFELGFDYRFNSLCHRTLLILS